MKVSEVKDCNNCELNEIPVREQSLHCQTIGYSGDCDQWMESEKSKLDKNLEFKEQKFLIRSIPRDKAEDGENFGYNYADSIVEANTKVKQAMETSLVVEVFQLKRLSWKVDIDG